MADQVIAASRQVRWTSINQYNHDAPRLVNKTDYPASPLQHSEILSSSSSHLRQAILKSADTMSTRFIRPKRKAAQDPVEPRKKTRTLAPPASNMKHIEKIAIQQPISSARLRRKPFSKIASSSTQPSVLETLKTVSMKRDFSTSQPKAQGGLQKKQTSPRHCGKVKESSDHHQSQNISAISAAVLPKKHQAAQQDEGVVWLSLKKVPELHNQDAQSNEEDSLHNRINTEGNQSILLLSNGITSIPEDFMDDDDSVFEEIFQTESRHLHFRDAKSGVQASIPLVDSTPEKELEALLAFDTPPSLFDEAVDISSPPCAQPITPTPLSHSHISTATTSRDIVKPLQPFLLNRSASYSNTKKTTRSSKFVETRVPVHVRVAEALQDFNAAKKSKTDATTFAVELYAQVVETRHDEHTRWLQLGDVFYPHRPPYLMGELKKTKNDQLLELGSAPLSRLSSNGSQCFTSSTNYQLCHLHLQTKLQSSSGAQKQQHSAVIQGQQVAWEILELRVAGWKEIEQIRDAVGIIST